MKFKPLALIAATILLSGCATPAYKTEFEVYCPPIKEYSQEFGLELADEVEQIPADKSRIVTVISDYIALRDLLRACQENSNRAEK